MAQSLISLAQAKNRVPRPLRFLQRVGVGMFAEWNILATHPTRVAHADGAIIALDGDSVVGIDPATGLQKFSVQ